LAGRVGQRGINPVALLQPLANQPRLLDLGRLRGQTAADLLLTDRVELPPDLLARLAHHTASPAPRRACVDAGHLPCRPWERPRPPSRRAGRAGPKRRSLPFAAPPVGAYIQGQRGYPSIRGSFARDGGHPPMLRIICPALVMLASLARAAFAQDDRWQI